MPPISEEQLQSIPEETRKRISPKLLVECNGIEYLCSKENLEKGKVFIMTSTITPDSTNNLNKTLVFADFDNLNQTGPRGPNIDGCFVATAVYGSPNAPQVQTLRNFRDNVLINYALGRSFVDFYYSGAGQKTAKFIEEKIPSTIPLIRQSLDLLVRLYEKNNVPNYNK